MIRGPEFDRLRAVMDSFRVFHVCHPILAAEQVWQTFQWVYSQPLVTYHDLEALTRDQAYNLFQLNMVFALGSIRLLHLGENSCHPFGFFTAALQIIAPFGFSFNSLGDIENFLLIARFGVYYRIGWWPSIYFAPSWRYTYIT